MLISSTGKQLSIHDVTIGEADPVTDPDLLMTIMETREELEDAQSEEDMTRIRDRNKGALHLTLLRRARTRKTNKSLPPPPPSLTLMLAPQLNELA